jgi:hypothetical protein
MIAAGNILKAHTNLLNAPVNNAFFYTSGRLFITAKSSMYPRGKDVGANKSSTMGKLLQTIRDIIVVILGRLFWMNII